MGRRRKRRRARADKATGATNSPAMGAEPEELTTKIYACMAWPALALGRHIRFENGFFVTDDADLQRTLERADHYGTQIQEVTEVVNKNRELGPEWSVFLCLRYPALSIDPRITFRDGVYATENEDLKRLVRQFSDYRREICEITDALVSEAMAADKDDAQAVA